MDLLLDYSGAFVFYVVLSAPFVVPILKGRRSGTLGLTLTTLTLVVAVVIIFIAHDTPKETALIGADMPEMDQMLGAVMLVSGLVWLPLALFALISSFVRAEPGSWWARRFADASDDNG